MFCWCKFCLATCNVVLYRILTWATLLLSNPSSMAVHVVVPGDCWKKKKKDLLKCNTQVDGMNGNYNVIFIIVQFVNEVITSLATNSELSFMHLYFALPPYFYLPLQVPWRYQIVIPWYIAIYTKTMAFTWYSKVFQRILWYYHGACSKNMALPWYSFC